MATPERKVKDAVVTAIRQHGLHYTMPVTGGYGASGEPDFILCVNGVFVGVETKYDCKRHRLGATSKAGKRIMTNAPTSLQRERMQSIRASGGISLVVDKHNVINFGVWLSSVLASGRCAGVHKDVVAMMIDAAKYYDVWYDVPPTKKVAV